MVLPIRFDMSKLFLVLQTCKCLSAGSGFTHVDVNVQKNILLETKISNSFVLKSMHFQLIVFYNQITVIKIITNEKIMIFDMFNLAMQSPLFHAFSFAI